jgi:hypothetical protein
MSEKMSSGPFVEYIILWYSGWGINATREYCRSTFSCTCIFENKAVWQVELSIFLSTGFFVVFHVSYFQVFILEIKFLLYNIVD